MKFDTKQPLTSAEAPAIFEALKDPKIKAILGTTTEIVEDAEPARPPLPNDDEQLHALKDESHKPRGRPKKEVLELDAEESKPAQDEQTAFPWEESAGDMDEKLAKLLSQKTGDMLK